MKSIKIIGGGIAGLSAGCYLQMNGYETEIYEMHSGAGGLCAAWKRGDYLIDGCIHWFIGCNPAGYMYKVWNGLLDMDKLDGVIYQEFCSVFQGKKEIRYYADVEELKKELKGISPQDANEIDKFGAAIKGFKKFEKLADVAESVVTWTDKVALFLKMLPMIYAFYRWKLPVEKYVERFKSEEIRKFLKDSIGEQTPTWILLINSAWFDNKDAGYPFGGAKELVSRIVKRYESLGGKIHYNSKIKKITVENGTANGIVLENGETKKADIVISAADGRDTIVNMLEGKYRDKYIEKLYYSGKYEPKTSGIYIGLGVAREFDETYRPYEFFDMKKPITVDGKEITKVGVTIHNFDPMASPKGKTVLTALVHSNDPNYWVKLRNTNREEYEKKKEAIAKHVIDEIDGHFGNIKNHLEVTDVATPATYVRYTNNWNGALMGWTDFNLYFNRPKKEIKGLKNFYMCGQWTGDAGLPGAAASGRELTRKICKRDGKVFGVAGHSK